MEIHNQPAQGPRSVKRSSEDVRIDITKPNREGIRRTTEELTRSRELEAKELELQARQREHRDQIELSDEARALASRGESTDGTDADRARVADLRQQYLDGTLNTDERVSRAAARILDGE